MKAETGSETKLAGFRGTRVALLTEIISPYRIPVFNCLAEDPRIDLQVLFLSETEDRRSWRISKDQIRFKYQILPGMLVGRAYQRGPLFFNPGVIIELMRRHCDVVICGGYHHPTYWLAMTYCHLARKRGLIWSESNLMDARPGQSIRELIKRYMMHIANGYIAAGRAQVEYLLHLGARREQIWIAPNAVDVDFFGQANELRLNLKNEFKKKLQLDTPVVLYVGRLLDEKGIPELLDAYSMISHSIHATLMLVGDGPDRAKYQAFCKERDITRVRFEGFVSQEDLPTYYAIADLLVSPTRSDPWGLVINEAMAAGLPVICSTSTGAAADLVHHEDNGYLHMAGNTAELADCIFRLLKDEPARERMGKRSREIISSYTPKLMARGFVEAGLALPNTNATGA